MDRDDLIRRHFEAMRDLTWAETLLPKFQRHGVNAEMLETYREAWNRHAEKRDWVWWQEEAKGDSTERLQDMLMECIDKLDALGMLQWSEQAKLKRILEGSNDQGDKRENPTQAKDRSRGGRD